MSAGISGIIFDKDGTLFDFDKTWGPVTGQMIVRECEGDPVRIAELAEVLGFDIANDRFFPGSLVIASTADKVEEAVLPFSKDRDRAALRDRMRSATASVAQVQVADLNAVLHDLRTLQYTLGVVTNDAIAPALSNLDQAGVRRHFDFIAGCDSGFGSKPDTGQLEAFCAHTGIMATACVMVGDSLHDLHAGRAAGMATVGVLTGPAPKEELAPHADVVLDSIADLSAWLKSR